MLSSRGILYFASRVERKFRTSTQVKSAPVTATTTATMVSLTSIDNIYGSAAGMRQSVAGALWHVRHRVALGALLVDQPAMTSVVADLALESEAAPDEVPLLSSCFSVNGESPHLERRVASRRWQHRENFSQVSFAPKSAQKTWLRQSEVVTIGLANELIVRERLLRQKCLILVLISRRR